MALTRTVETRLTTDSKQYVAGIRTALAATNKFGRDTRRYGRQSQGIFGSTAKAVATLAGAYIGTQGLITVVSGAIREQQESIKVNRQTAAVLKSTGGAAGVTAKQIQTLSQRLSEQTAIDDEAIQSAQNLLLTFTAIGKDIFPQTTQAILDLSVATGQNLNRSAIQVGKALQDPIRGITALRRVGVNFSTDQQEVIKRLVETGKVAEAQKLILKELAVEFGGSAAAQATPLDRLRVTYNNLLETLGGYLVPILNDAANALIKFVDEFRRGVGSGGEFKTTMQGLITTLGPIAVALFNVGKFLAQHPRLILAAAGAWVAYKATIASLNLYSTILAALPGPGPMAQRGKLAGSAWTKAFRAGLLIGLVALVPDISAKLQQLVPALSRYSGGKGWGNLGQDLAKAIGSGFNRGMPGIFGIVANAVAGARKVAEASRGGFLSDGKAIAQSLARGIKSAADSVVSSVGGALSSALSKARGFVSNFLGIGQSISQGLASGISSAVGSIVSAAQNAVRQAQEAARRQAKSKSPSLVFAEIGEDLVAGMALGMSRTKPVTAAAKKIVRAAAGATTSPMTGVPLGSFLSDPITGGPGLDPQLLMQQERLAKAEAALDKARDDAGKKRSKAESARIKALLAEVRAAQNAVSGIERQITRREALVSIRDQLRGFVDQAVAGFREVRQAAAQAALDTANAAAAAARDASLARLDETTGDSPQARRLRELRAEQERLAREREDSAYTTNRADLEAQLAKAVRNGNVRAQAELNAQIAQLDQDRRDTERQREIDALATSLQAQRDNAQSEYDARVANNQAIYDDTVAQNEAATANFQANLEAQLSAERTNLENRTQNYRDFAARVQAILASAGIAGAFTPSTSDEAAVQRPESWKERIAAWLRTKPRGSYDASDIGRAIGTTKANVWANKPSLSGYSIKNRVSGGALATSGLTLVGETGPELLMGNGQVVSASRTNRMSGAGVTLNVYPQTTADDPVALARALGWQLATR